MKDRWEHFDHDADIGVRGIGGSKARAFEQAALALTAVVTPPERVRPIDSVTIECSAPDDDLLLAAWLNAVIYQMAVHRMLFCRFDLTLDKDRLHAQAVGEPLSVERHEPAVEVKGATYTELKVAQAPDGGWIAQTVVDV